MRYSIHDTSSPRCTVMLNGSVLADVIWADDELGEAEIYEQEWALDRRGQRVEDPSCPSGCRTLLVKGDIRLIFESSSPDCGESLFPSWMGC